MNVPTRIRWLVIGLLLAALPLLALPTLHKQITLIVDGTPALVETYALTVGGVLKSAGIPLAEADQITPALNHRLRDGDQVTITRAAQIALFVDGETRMILTAERIPVVILAEAGVSLSPEDTLLADGRPIALDEPLPPAPAHSLQVRRARSVTLDENGAQRVFRSTAATLSGALWEQGVPLFISDILEPIAATPLRGAITARWVPAREVTIQTMQASLTTRTTAATVGAALAESGITLQGSDYSLPAEDAPLPEDGVIQVVRVREEVQLEQVPLPFSTIQQALPDLEIDNTQVVQAGEFGLKAQRVRVVLEARPGEPDWTEVSRQVEDEWVARPPQPRVIGYGTKIVVRTTSTSDGVIEYWRAVEVFATSYSPCRLGIPNYCNSTTASGKLLQKGIIAVKRSWYNMMRGLPVYIPGYGFATIEDVGAGIAGQNWIDLGYSDEDWVSWSRNVTLYFLTPVPANVMWILE